jgi:hypothetical protein
VGDGNRLHGKVDVERCGRHWVQQEQVTKNTVAGHFWNWK